MLRWWSICIYQETNYLTSYFWSFVQLDWLIIYSLFYTHNRIIYSLFIPCIFMVHTKTCDYISRSQNPGTHTQPGMNVLSINLSQAYFLLLSTITYLQCMKTHCTPFLTYVALTILQGRGHILLLIQTFLYPSGKTI